MKKFMLKIGSEMIKEVFLAKSIMDVKNWGIRNCGKEGTVFECDNDKTVTVDLSNGSAQPIYI